MWVGAFITFITGKHIQVGTIEVNVMFCYFSKISLYVIRSLCSTKVALWSSGPSFMSVYTSVRTHTGKFIAIAFGLFIKISVLVMNSEHKAKFFHSLRKLLHPFPTTGFGAGRKVVGMIIVIPGLCPAIKMEIELIHTKTF